MVNGVLVISLDFELLWGVFDKVDWREKREYFQNTRKLIPDILKLFEKYKIQSTWATVGMLFNEDWEEWNENIPDTQPQYKDSSLSAYKFGKSIQCKETEELCFAPELIKLIKETPGQEIATHTYSHYYCLEQGQDLESYKADLLQTVKMAGKLDVNLKSLVFPRNQFNEAYLNICSKFGIVNVRSNPSNWYWREPENNSLLNKIFRSGDAYFGSNDKSYKFSRNQLRGGIPFSQKASRFLRPFSEVSLLNDLKLKRIKNEMTNAATAKEIYHLWWHPHNFGNHPKENLRDLENLLIHFKSLREKYNFQSLNMCEIGNGITD